VSWDGTNTPVAAKITGRLILSSGQFTTTVKDSEDISSIEAQLEDISWDGTNTLWCGRSDQKLYLQSGQFTSTLKTSESVGSIDIKPQGISTDDFEARVPGVTLEKIAGSTVTFAQIATTQKISNLTSTSTVTFGQSTSGIKVFEVVAESTVTFVSVAATQSIFDAAAVSTVNFTQTAAPQKIVSIAATSELTFLQASINDTAQLSVATNTLTFTHTAIASHLVCSDRPNLSRWIKASVSEYFKQFAFDNDIHFFAEGTYRYTPEYQQYIEFRMDGPSATELSKGYWKLDAEINILWGYNQDDDFHGPERLKGLIMEAMDEVCIYRYGDGHCDDQTLVGQLRRVHDKRNATRVSDFGQIRQDVRMMQGTIECTYKMFVTE
jgi:hypothetical protein